MLGAHLPDHCFQFGGFGIRASASSTCHIKHAEFVAAESGHHVGGADVGRQRRGHRLEQRVAGGMAVAVIDRLEAVEVDEHQRDAGADSA